jgi:hypothetical protein
VSANHLEYDPASGAVLRLLSGYHRRTAALQHQRLLWQQGLELLGAQGEAWRAARPLRGAAAAAESAAQSASAGGPARPPALWLLYAPPWSQALGPAARIFLQGIGDRLYLRVQGAPPPGRLGLAVDLGGGRVRRVGLAPKPRLARFGLTLLNGGGRGGLAWHARDLDPAEVLGGAARALSLRWEQGGAERLLPVCDLSPLAGGQARAAPLDDGGRLQRSQRQLSALIGHYNHGRAEDFRAGLSGLLREPLPSRGGAPRQRWRSLSLVQSLWLSAMGAELARLGGEVFRAYGGPLLAAHPQSTLAPTLDL